MLWECLDRKRITYLMKAILVGVIKIGEGQVMD